MQTYKYEPTFKFVKGIGLQGIVKSNWGECQVVHEAGQFHVVVINNGIFEEAKNFDRMKDAMQYCQAILDLIDSAYN
jgi:hypothetical protein